MIFDLKYRLLRFIFSLFDKDTRDEVILTIKREEEIANYKFHNELMKKSNQEMKEFLGTKSEDFIDKVERKNQEIKFIGYNISHSGNKPLKFTYKEITQDEK